MATIEMHLIAERSLRIMNPISEAKLMLVGQLCQLRAGMRWLDLGCGKAEMICRFVQAHGLHAVGVDYFQELLDIGQQRAVELGVADRVTLVQGDAAAYQPEAADFDVVSCIGAPWIGGSFVGTLELMKRFGTLNGLYLIGDAYWTETPEQAYAAWDKQPGAQVTLVETLDRIDSAGMELVEMVLSTPDEWDRFEAAQWMAVHDHLRAHPDDETARAAHVWKAKQRRAYLQYARRYFNWGIFVLRQPVI
ncbi:MAG: methyltransferase domain-containing protein [Chloroflexota bacterium]|nr:methyltransferase domain-containing protein [Chloroflexota bacterium]